MWVRREKGGKRKENITLFIGFLMRGKEGEGGGECSPSKPKIYSPTNWRAMRGISLILNWMLTNYLPFPFSPLNFIHKYLNEGIQVPSLPPPYPHSNISIHVKWFIPVKEQWFYQIAESKSIVQVRNQQKVCHCSNLDIYEDRMSHPKRVQ